MVTTAQDRPQLGSARDEADTPQLWKGKGRAVTRLILEQIRERDQSAVRCMSKVGVADGVDRMVARLSRGRMPAEGEMAAEGEVACDIELKMGAGASPGEFTTSYSVLRFGPRARYRSAAALSLVATALIVAGYQRVLPRAVRMSSAIRSSAIA